MLVHYVSSRNHPEFHKKWVKAFYLIITPVQQGVAMARQKVKMYGKKIAKPQSITKQKPTGKPAKLEIKLSKGLQV